MMPAVQSDDFRLLVFYNFVIAFKSSIRYSDGCVPEPELSRNSLEL